ncbi:Hypothetical protein NTJ_00936 [Nesidiocoris tenuis]|uniref:Uncharacterized protein n=1 Tax=Nesidiocoris tenuis TaxID=355587 RepID=A0ABN7A7J8_9HEMI|nr:Hypothetical protein NTJ_00936 [Nesidiocoris tenuis]
MRFIHTGFVAARFERARSWKIPLMNEVVSTLRRRLKGKDPPAICPSQSDTLIRLIAPTLSFLAVFITPLF